MLKELGHYNHKTIPIATQRLPEPMKFLPEPNENPLKLGRPPSCSDIHYEAALETTISTAV